MGRLYITDLSDFLDEEASAEDGPSRKFARYLGLIVEAASVMKPGERGHLPMRCANPLQRKRCQRQLMAMISPDGIEWYCHGCFDEGLILNWARTRFDLSSVLVLRPSEEEPNVVLPLQELDAARRVRAGQPSLRRLLAEATNIGGNYFCFPAACDELVWLRDTAMTAADAARGEDRRLLDRFSARMDAFITTLAEVPEDEAQPRELLN